MAASQPQPNGASAGSKTVIGINFGDSYASIAVLSNEKTAECIANENGERQIACAVSYNGEETYIGNQALPQLVKNARNTITGFRNLLGKKFCDVSEQYTNTTSSAPVIKHPDSDLPGYSVERDTRCVCAAHPTPSPPPEPQRLTKILSVPEVTTLFLRSLLQSATDYLGTRVDGAVLAVPTWFSPEARAALTEAAEAAGIHVLQLLDEPGAAALLPRQDTDQTVLVLDAGASGVPLALLALRAGLAHVLGSSTTPGCGAKAIDDRLVAFFAKEFMKKTKTPLVLPAQNEEDARAERKLRLAVDATKRTLSAGVGGAAACSVESLKAGLDLAGSINRLRFDLSIYPLTSIRRFSDVSEQYTNTTSSAPIIKHPDSDLPAYSRPELAVIASLKGTPAASAQPTPAPSPPPAPQCLTKILSVPEVTTLFLRSLLQSATDYLRTRVDGAVLAQLLNEPSAAALLLPQVTDQTVLALDAGASGVSLSVLVLRAGPAHVLRSRTMPGCGAKATDIWLVTFFAKEVSKKTETALALPAQNEEGPGGAIDSLKDGLDLAGSTARLRFDLEVAPVYRVVASPVHALRNDNGLETLNVDAVLLVGASPA
ncbi:actin-like ATPase domain-containing protein [Auricularia subglabra TFB-10046 SS5]|nr:actin-like ATPase domain-containing protein [Auricularia subglabra TFB-10046 SS5]